MVHEIQNKKEITLKLSCMPLNKNLSLLIVILIAIAPLVYLAAIWSSIPDIVPVHFDSNFKPDRLDSKNTLWLGCGILASASVLVYLALQNIRKIDPKQKGKSTSTSFKRLAIVIVVFMAAINIIIILSAVKSEELMKRVLFPLLGFMFAFIGNYMANLKPNYFAGIRLPWTLSSDYNWKKTHHLAGKLWFFGGLTAAIVSLFTPFSFAMVFTLSIVFIMVIIPCVYSYLLFRREGRE